MSKPQRYGPSENWDSYLASMRESDSGDYYHRDDIDPILERVKVLEALLQSKAEQGYLHTPTRLAAQKKATQ